MDTPEYLYHYTNIESLALILKNKTIRFNSLDKMDDKQEQMSSDLKNIAKLCYVSSWTDKSDEDIPMWNIYASLDRGVRIKLKKLPFKKYDYSSLKSNTIPFFLTSLGSNLPDKGFIPIKVLSSGFFAIQLLSPQYILSKIIYTNDNSLLYPTLNHLSCDTSSIDFGKLGHHKNKSWEFQNEWRYIIELCPQPTSTTAESFRTDFYDSFRKLEQDKSIECFPYIDLEIADDAFDEMEITPSPCLSAGNTVILEALIEKYNPSAKITESTFKGLL